MPDFIFASQADIEVVEGEVSALEQNKQDLTEKVSAIEEADKANTDKYTSVKAVVDYVEPLKNSVSNGKSLVASAITNKGVTTAADASFDTMATNINSIKLGSGNATADKVLSPYTFTNSTGEEQTGTIPSKAAATITPGTTNKTISAGQYLSGTQTIAGDANLVAANIKSGVSIFGVTGTLTAQDLGGTVLKSVTKTLTLSRTGTNCGLTNAQRAGLYSIQVVSSETGGAVAGFYYTGAASVPLSTSQHSAGFYYSDNTISAQSSTVSNGSATLTFYYFE